MKIRADVERRARHGRLPDLLPFRLNIRWEYQAVDQAFTHIQE
jgi:hypothetical protein